MKKILFIIILLLIPISAYAKEDYKIIADIDLEVEDSSSVSYKKYDDTLIITTKNELYKINTITGEKKSVHFENEIIPWQRYAYDSNKMTLNNNIEKLLVIGHDSTGNNSIIYLLDADLNIINQQPIKSGSYYNNIYIVKDKLMVYYITNDSDYNQILNIKIYNKDLSLFKTIVKEDKVDYYDFSTYKFNNRADWYGDLDDLSYYYTFDDNYDIVKKIIKRESY